MSPAVARYEEAVAHYMTVAERNAGSNAAIQAELRVELQALFLQLEWFHKELAKPNDLARRGRLNREVDRLRVEIKSIKAELRRPFR